MLGKVNSILLPTMVRARVKVDLVCRWIYLFRNVHFIRRFAGSRNRECLFVVQLKMDLPGNR